MQRRAFLEAGLSVPLAGVASAQSSKPARQTIPRTDPGARRPPAGHLGVLHQAQCARARQPPRQGAQLLRAGALARRHGGATALVDGLDYYGCDGRPRDLQTDARWKKSGTESGRGMTLLGNGERYLAIARRKGVKSLWLAENHNMSARYAAGDGCRGA
ncbi:MAG: hypothetical protein ACR2LU_11110 [Luteitalea sp.]